MASEKYKSKLDKTKRKSLGSIYTETPKPNHPPKGPSGVSPNPDGSR